MEEERTWLFMQDGATTHTVIYFSNILNQVFEDKLKSHRWWPARSLDLNLYNFYV